MATGKQLVLPRVVSHPRRCAAVLAAVVLFLRRYWLRRCKPHGVAIVPGHWLLGRLLPFLKMLRATMRSEQLEHFCAKHLKLGPTYVDRLPLMTQWWVVTACPQNVEHILVQNAQNYKTRSWRLSRLIHLLRLGTFASDGQNEFPPRPATRTLASKNLNEQLWAVARRNSQKLRDILQIVEGGTSVNMFAWISRFTSDTFTELGVGKCNGSLGGASSPFSQTIDNAERSTLNRFCATFCRMPKVCEDVTDSDVRNTQDCNTVVLRELADRGKDESENRVRDAVQSFLAFSTPTAEALAWTLSYLCKHPEADAKLRHEIRRVCGKLGPADEDIDRLPYLQAVINEALRLHPFSSLGATIAAGDDTLPDGTALRRGTVVFCNIYAMGRDRTFWGEDAESFRPERWLEKSSKRLKHQAFNIGTSDCLSRRVAEVMMKTCLAVLLPQLSFKLAVPADQVTSHLQVGMGRGLLCRIVDIEEREQERLEESSSTIGGLSDCASNLSDFTSLYSDVTPGSSDLSETPSEADERTRLHKRRSGRARQREKRRRRLRTPSPP